MDDGEEFIVTRNGKPVGELRPFGRGKFISKERFLAMLEGSPHIDHRQFREDIDRYVDQDPTPRG